MKAKLNLLFLAITLILGSCDKEERVMNKLQGTWEMRHATGIQIPGVSPNFPSGNGHIVKFDNDQYEMYSGGKLIISSKFVLKAVDEENDGIKYDYKLVYEEYGHSSERHLKVKGNTLIIAFGGVASDGGTSTYVRL